MSGWLSHWAFSAGLYFHSILYLLWALCLSKRPLKQFTVDAVTMHFLRQVVPQLYHSVAKEILS